MSPHQSADVKISPDLIDKFREDVRGPIARAAAVDETWTDPVGEERTRFAEALEELRVAEEELRAQNEEILSAREALEQDDGGEHDAGTGEPGTGEPGVTGIEHGVGGSEWRVARAEGAARSLRRQLELERGAREAAEAASRAKTDFLATLSHELRTPLQALVGYTEILQSGMHGSLTELQTKDLERMQRSEQHLLRLINTVLDFIQLESGIDGELERRAFSVPDVLRGTHALIAPQLEKKGLVFVSRYAEPAPSALADASHVQQIVLNLLSNAVKFTPAGGTVTVETAYEDESVVVKVTDTGIGIPADMVEAVFEPFIQARGAAILDCKGTGLGLAISRRLAEAMGGSLTAESRQGSGSTFTLTLPAAPKHR